MFSYEQFKEISGSQITLVRLGAEHIDELAKSLFSPTSWVMAWRGIGNAEKLRAYLNTFIEKNNRGESLTLVARIGKNAGELVAISTYHSAGLQGPINPNGLANFLKVEIGFTWVADKWQRTFVNTEKKLLMINYAFEKMGVKRVEFSVDPRNEKSNLAMRRIGAKFEGTLRKWRFLNDRDEGNRNIYSIIDDEWPETREHLEKLLAR